MMKKLLIIIILGLFGNLCGQNIDQWRDMGYKAKLKGDYQTAIKYYSKILKIKPEDYDAKLALARLYFKTEQYGKTEKMFRTILNNDSTDVEALKGLGDVCLMTDRLKQSISFYKRGLHFLPNYIPIYFKLAKAYSWDGELDKAIETYKKILNLDNTYSEAWQGIGKMYYWMEKPETALSYYRKAIKLDPTNEEILNEFHDIQENLKFQLNSKFNYVNERESSYNIDAFIQKYIISKRVNNFFNFSMGFLLDHSNRDFSNTTIGDTVRWYDNIFLKFSYISQYHKLDIYSGYTSVDNKFSSYGLAWKMDFSLNNFDVKNTFNGGYDYFYYWNQVGQYILEDNANIKYGKIKFTFNVSYGLIDSMEIADVPNNRYEKDINPHFGYGLSFSYIIFNMPKIEVGVNYSYLNFKYKSHYYYSPMGRVLYGPYLMLYYHVNDFYIYGNFSYNPGSEYYYDSNNNNLQKNYVDVTNWSAEFETGYDYKNFSISLGSSRFYNPFYANFVSYFSVKYNL